MKEHELLHRAMNAYGLDREAIRQAARCRGAARLHKGGTSMKQKWTAAAAVLAACLCLGGGVYAADYFLSASEAARAGGSDRLAALFEGDAAVTINQTQADAGYTVTLLGLTSGERLAEYWSSYWTEEYPLTGRTYAVLAVQGQEGTEPEADFAYENSSVLPVITTTELAPWQYWLDPQRSDVTVDGVRYLLVGCDELEPFADQGGVLCLSTGGIGWNGAAFHYDAATGTVTANPDYDGVNLVFDLPLDASRADPDKAQAFIEQWKNGSPETAGPDPTAPGGVAEAVDNAVAAAAMDPDEIRAAGTLRNTETVRSTSDPGYSGGGFWPLPDGGTLALGAIAVGQTQVMPLLAQGTAEQATLVTRNADDTLTVEVYDLSH